jgi:hypothetical protein
VTLQVRQALILGLPDLIMNIVGDNQELKDAVAKISAAIEASGNKDAADSWTDFLEEAAAIGASPS